MPKINFIVHFSLKIFYFKKSCNLTDSILAHNSGTRILPDIGLVIKYQQQYLFHFRLFPRKLISNFFQKIQQKPLWALFVQICATMNFFGKKKALSVFKYCNFLPSHHKSENKTNEPFLRKTSSWRTDRQTLTERQRDRQTNKSNFIWSSVGQEPQK